MVIFPPILTHFWSFLGHFWSKVTILLARDLGARYYAPLPDSTMVGLVGTQGTQGYPAWARAGGLPAYVTKE